MFLLADAFRQHLVTFLAVSGSLLAAVFVFLLIQRGLDEWRFRRRMRLTRRFQPLVDALLTPEPEAHAYRRLVEEGRPHAPELAGLLLRPLGVATGALVANIRRAAHDLGLVERWTLHLGHRQWWERAEAARALGLVRERAAVAALLRALEDDHEEVRAAAVEALGAIGDVQALPVLLASLRDESRHQRARVVEALRGFGEAVMPALLGHVREHPDEREMAAELVGLIGGTGGLGDLLAWSGDDRPSVRASVMRALAVLGLDDRAYYYVLRALRDPEPEVRAMAARTLGRSGRREATAELAPLMNDQWLVAAHAAAALKSLGVAGLARLAAFRDAPGQAGDLARQMLWERETLQDGALSA